MKKAKKLLSVILSIALVLSMVPVSTITAKAAEDSVTLDISQGIIVIDSDGYTQGDNDKVSHTGAYVISGTYTSSTAGETAIAVAAGADVDITLEDVTITMSGTNGTAMYIKSSYDSSTEVATGATVRLHLSGTSTLKSGIYAAGIQTSIYSTLIIDGDGSLYAYGGTGGAGIGGGYSTSRAYAYVADPSQNKSAGGLIVIKSGYVYAQGGSSGSGIGYGDYPTNPSDAETPTYVTEVYITGGTVYAYANGGTTSGYSSDMAAGIGSGGDQYNTSNVFGTTYDGVTGDAIIYASVISDSDDTSSWTGLICQSKVIVVYGDVTVDSLTVASGYTLVIPEGSSLTVTGDLTLSNNSSYSQSGTITVGGTLTNSATTFYVDYGNEAAMTDILSSAKSSAAIYYEVQFSTVSELEREVSFKTVTTFNSKTYAKEAASITASVEHAFITNVTGISSAGETLVNESAEYQTSIAITMPAASLAITATVTECVHSYVNGICSFCSHYEEPALVDDVYQIENLGQYLWFAALTRNDTTNAEFDTYNTAANAILLADIGTEEDPVTEMIGVATSYPYSGTFDGNYHTVTLDIAAQSASATGMFRSVKGATIKNVNVSGNINASTYQFGGSLIGRTESSATTTVEGCTSDATITSSKSGDGTHGGLIGVNYGTLTMNNCGFTGTIEGSSTNASGGLIGYTSSKVTISNSFHSATFDLSSTNCENFCRNTSYVTLVNCYYVNALNSSSTQGTQVTEDQVASGELAHLLQADQEELAWGQDITGDDVDETPVITDDTSKRVVTFAIELVDEDEEENETLVEECYVNSVVYDSYPVSDEEQSFYRFYDNEDLEEEIDTTTYIPETDVVLYAVVDYDYDAPTVEGVEDGATYEGDVTISISDDNIASIVVDGVTLDTTTASYTITADDASHTVTVADRAGNVTTVTFTVNKIVEATTEEATTEESTTEESTTTSSTTTTTTTTTTSAAVGTVLKDATGSSYKVTVAGASPEVTLTKAGSGMKGTVTINTVTIDGVTYKVTSIAAKAFKGNKNITKLTIGNNVTKIGASAFEGCTKLKSVTIGTGLVSIGKKAFFKCTALTKVNIKSKVLKTIGASAFEKCTKLKSFKSVSTVLKKIGKKCFNGDKKLKKVILKTTKLTKKGVGNKAFAGIAAKCTFKVPKKLIKSYKTIFVARGATSTIKVKK